MRARRDIFTLLAVVLLFVSIVGTAQSSNLPPNPNPMGWAYRPYVSGNGAIAMEAITATDPNGVEYYFTCSYGSGHDSGWQDSTIYEDTGLTAGQTYTYTVMARDKSINRNTTMASVPASRVVETITGLVYWDFEDYHPMATSSRDTIRGIHMYGFDSTYGLWFSPETLTGSGWSAYFADNHCDGYTTDTFLNAWSPQEWTIEVSVNLLELSGWETLIGRDGSSQGEPNSDFYLQNNGIDDKFRIDFDTVGGQRWILDGNYLPVTNQWYRLAVTSDGITLRMYLDNGSGFTEIGSLDISVQSVADNALAATNYNWTFGRGWYGGSFVDHIDGYLDNIRFSEAALTPDQFLGAPGPLIPWLYGDFTGNHFVDLYDFVSFSKLWLLNDCITLTDFDTNDDCTIGVAELEAMAENWLIPQ